MFRSIVWFRQDLRLQDNPALLQGVNKGEVLPVYILDDINADRWSMGSASRWWLHHSLQALDQSLAGNLRLQSGNPLDIIPQLAAEFDIDAVYWNRCYEPWQTALDTKLETRLQQLGIQTTPTKGSLIWEPWENLKQDGTPYKVFTPFYKKALTNLQSPQQTRLEWQPDIWLNCRQDEKKLDELKLLPDFNWYQGIDACWQPGESGASRQLSLFLDSRLQNYQRGRDYPAHDAVSRLSPHLRFGEISPQQVLYQVRQFTAGIELESESEHFLRELAWREFSYHLLYYFPTLSDENLRQQFDDFPWHRNETELTRWQQGLTGFPIVDAGMRELWQTGYMHNRVRMIVASFLVKNLMQHWLEGARWFWDCLVDADLANNSCSWQWVAGSGADAAPYFRIFNPVTQSQKFDSTGSYIKRYVPELQNLEGRILHDPSSAPPGALNKAGVALDENYPRAMVDLRQSRQRALDAYKTISGKPVRVGAI